LFPFYTGGTLGKDHCRLSEKDAKTVLAQLLLFADLMEQEGIIHRDIKPDNILLCALNSQKFDIRIADMGYAI
jgi:serine/threonine protein kinase